MSQREDDEFCPFSVNILLKFDYAHNSEQRAEVYACLNKDMSNDEIYAHMERFNEQQNEVPRISEET